MEKDKYEDTMYKIAEIIMKWQRNSMRFPLNPRTPAKEIMKLLDIVKEDN